MQHNNNQHNNSEKIDVEQLYMWDFDFNFYTIKSKHTLITMACDMFDDLFYSDTINFETTNPNINYNLMNKIDKLKLHMFIHQVAIYYHDYNSYHNLSHAVSTLHFLYMIIKTMDINKYINELNLFGLMISALIHDINHPGHTNQYEINSKSFISKKYNNKSVLENHHCEFGLKIIECLQINLFNNLSQNEKEQIKIIISQSIMSTDMLFHNELINNLIKLKEKLLNNHLIKLNDNFNICNILFYPNINKQNTTHLLFIDQIILCQSLLHACDLCNPIKKFSISSYVIKLLQQEYKKQIIKELQNDLPLSSYLIKNNIELFLNEIDFCNDIVLPLYKHLEFFSPTFKILTTRIEFNIKIWSKLCTNLIK